MSYRHRTLAIAVTVATVFSTLISALFGSGLLGATVEESSRGIFGSESTLIVPASKAFSIWGLIFTGFIVYTIWMWVNKTAKRYDDLAILAAVSIALNGVWLIVVQLKFTWISVPVIVAIWISLWLLRRRLTAIRRDYGTKNNWLDVLAVDLVFGIYLGWITVATAANISAALAASGVEPTNFISYLVTIVMLVMVLAVGVFFVISHHSIAPALTMVWAFVWIAVERFTGDPYSLLIGLLALLSAAAALLVSAVHLLPGQFVSRITRG
ncbi:MAG: tryptophan-rich sensory protein [Actinomycetaceae bacterium]|nr:tryptophan-rich sensory protein [Actinomycetaceae bacterium]